MRKIGRGLALSLLLTPGMAWSLGLGDISVDTGLDQALQAEIELLSVRPSDIEDMQVTLAGSEAFERAGIDRPVVLNKLEFEPVSLDSGRGAIRVTTTEPVREPFLNFLVEVRWPKGRLLREYTILLDPPLLMEQRPVAGLQAPVVTPEPAFSPEPAPEPVIIEQAPALEPAPEFVLDQSEEVTFAEPAAPTAGISEAPPASPVEAVTFSEETSAITLAESTETIGEPSIAPADSAQEVTIVFDESAQDELPQPLFEPLATEQSEAIVIAEEASVTEMVPDNQFGESNIGPPLREPTTVAEESESVVSAGDSYEVQRGDTLTRITQEYRPGTDVQQMMLAFLRANPDAFFENNVNNLRAGAILRIPAESEALELGRRDAVAEVRRQNALWREFKGLLASQPPTSPAAVVDLTIADAQPDFSSPEPNIEELLSQPVTVTEEIGTSTEVAAPEPTIVTPVEAEPAIVDDGRLEIVSSEAEIVSSEAAAAAGATQDTALETDLALAKELAESRLQENQELGDKIGELEEMLTKNERIIDLQNEQLAELQQQLAEAEAADAASAESEAATEEITAEAAPTEATTSEQVTFEGEPEAPTTTPSEGTLEEPVVAAATGQEEAAEEPATVATEAEEVEPEQTAESVEPTVAVEDTPEPVVEEATTPETVTAQTGEATEPSEQQAVVDQDTVVTQADQPNLVQDLFANPMMLLAAGGAGLLMLLLIGMGVRKSMENRAVTVDLDELKAADEAAQDVSMPEMGLPSGLHDEHSITRTEEAPTLATPAPDFTQLEPTGDTEQVMLTPEDQEALQQAASEQDDIINDDTVAEADVYIAYGLHQQAEELLTNAIAENPERNDYRVKLLETYYGGKDKEKFDALAEELHGQLNGGTGMLWERVVAMGKEISPENSLFSGADAGGLSVEDFAPKKPESADIDLGADDLGAVAEPDFDLSTERNMSGDSLESTQVLGTEELEAAIDQPTAEQPAPPSPVGVGLAAAATGAAAVGGSLFGANDDDGAGEPPTEASTEQVGDAGDSNILEFDMQDLDLDARTVQALDEPTDAHTQEQGLDFDIPAAEGEAFQAPGLDDLDTQEADAEFDIETESLEAVLGADDRTEALDFSEPESETADLDFETQGLDIDADTESLEVPVTEARTEGLDIDLDTESLDAALNSADGVDLEHTQQMTEVLDRSETGLGPDEDTFAGSPPTEDALDISLDDDDLTGGVQTVLREDIEEDVAALDINMDLAEEQSTFTDSGSFDVEEFSTEEIDMQQATEQLSIPDGLGLDDELPSLEDEVGTKLDLAKAYIDMGDSEGARSTLEEVIKDGNPNQRNEAEELMVQIA